MAPMPEYPPVTYGRSFVAYTWHVVNAQQQPACGTVNPLSTFETSATREPIVLCRRCRRLRDAARRAACAPLTDAV
jgi:hypothetical protein